MNGYFFSFYLLFLSLYVICQSIYTFEQGLCPEAITLYKFWDHETRRTGRVGMALEPGKTLQQLAVGDDDCLEVVIDVEKHCWSVFNKWNEHFKVMEDNQIVDYYEWMDLLDEKWRKMDYDEQSCRIKNMWTQVRYLFHPDRCPIIGQMDSTQKEKVTAIHSKLNKAYGVCMPTFTYMYSHAHCHVCMQTCSVQRKVEIFTTG